MNLINVLPALDSILNKSNILYLFCDKDLIDFCEDFKFNLNFSNPQGNFSLEVQPQVTYPGVFCTIYEYLESEIFSNPDKVLICWDIKKLISYFYKRQFNRLSRLDLKCKVFDLKLIYNYLNKQLDMPSTFQEALHSLKQVSLNNEWLEIHSRIHVPLSFRTLPSMETRRVSKNGHFFYSHYRIEGQINGRLSTAMPTANYLNPHSIKPEERSLLGPEDPSKIWLMFDYSSMEVSIVQWITQDQHLLDVMKSGPDFFNELFKLLFGRSIANSNERSFAKDIFLPTVFGQGAFAISQELKISLASATEILNTLKKEFSVLFNYLEDVQEKAQAGPVADYFHRHRSFQENETYKSRNFVFQAPAAVVCLDKLNGLSQFNDINIIFSIHDGYVIECDKNKAPKVCSDVIHFFEQEDSFYPGLKLKVKPSLWN